MRRGSALLLLAVVLAPGLVGCPEEVRPGPEVRGAAKATGTGAAPVTLTVTPSPPRQLQPTTFIVTAHPSLGSGATVAITLSMQGMAMPPTRIATHPLGSGKYQGSGAFTMAGDWTAHITVTGAGQPLSKDITVHVD